MRAPGALSTAMAGLSSSLALPSAATRIGFDHGASGPFRTTTYTYWRALSLHGVARTNE